MKGEVAAFSLGANLGRPSEALIRALAGLETVLASLAVSPLFRTEPLSTVSQPPFYNLAVLGATELSPEALLDCAQALERAAGRKRAVKDGPRSLDVDLLLVGDRVLETHRLTLPHPRLRRRRFVLAPLACLAPELPVPPDGRRVRDLLLGLDRLPGRGGAVEEVPWPVEALAGQPRPLLRLLGAEPI